MPDQKLPSPSPAAPSKSCGQTCDCGAMEAHWCSLPENHAGCHLYSCSSAKPWLPSPAAPVEVEGMLSKEERDALRILRNDPRDDGAYISALVKIKYQLLDSHDVCERELREASQFVERVYSLFGFSFGGPPPVVL